MHPEILRLISDQRGREMRAQANRARLARMVKSGRRGRNLPDQADEFVLPDYVDGSFRTESADLVDGPVASGTGHAPAAQRAA
jgi:hypothetical protein